ncbi:FAD:protein FMN transferase, partial [Providencia alcalifaciens]
RIAIEKPANDVTKQSVQLIIEPDDNSIATSGDYRNYFEENGVRFSHTIDPTTGHPIKHNLVSITVIVPTCMSADGLSTGLNVLGPEKGLGVPNELNIPVFMIVKTENGFEERYSKAFAPFLKK